jgi:hypothetical protein
MRPAERNGSLPHLAGGKGVQLQQDTLHGPSRYLPLLHAAWEACFAGWLLHHLQIPAHTGACLVTCLPGYLHLVHSVLPYLPNEAAPTHPATPVTTGFLIGSVDETLDVDTRGAQLLSIGFG